ncbi:MAG: hypothetical protein ACP5DZ_07150 [Bacteroidales bacterium]
MNKYSLYLKIALFIILSIVFVACPDPIYKECTWEARTTKMLLNVCKPESYNIPVYECDALKELDSCSYDSLRINLSFEAEILPNQETCSSPHDSLIGFIYELYVISINDYNDEFKAFDTLNSILDITYMEPIGAHGKYEMIESPINLQGYLSEKPVPCTPSIFMFLNTPPDTTRLQQFIIEYEEEDGTKYQDTTPAIYVKP